MAKLDDLEPDDLPATPNDDEPADQPVSDPEATPKADEDEPPPGAQPGPLDDATGFGTNPRA